mgnify:CR=1 FL=1
MNYFIEYFGQYERIDQYLKEQKLEQVKNFPFQLPGMADEDEFFAKFDISPEDMKFSVTEPNGQIFDRMLNKTSSHTNMSSIPGKSIRLLVTETTTNTIVGFIRLGSPVINSKPRNVYLGRPLQTTDMEEMGRFNNSAIMGFVIVPTQPFGYNYLGGKLLAALCCSHEVREKLNKKYGMNLCMFETTSLYGSSKAASQYDGMKPMLRNRGLTDSDFIPMIHGKPFKDLLNYVEDKIGVFIKPDASSRKLKIINAIIGMIKKTLDGDDLDKFKTTITNAKKLTERKRYYVSNYGIENYIDIVNGKTNEIVKAPNFDRYYSAELIEWWRKNATKRYNKLKAEDRLRNDLEVWTPDSNIDIIR